MNDLFAQRCQRPIKYFFIENICLAGVIIAFIAYAICAVLSGMDTKSMEISGKAGIAIICAPFMLFYVMRKMVFLILDLLMHKTETQRVFITRVHNHRVYYFLIVKGFLTKKNEDRYCMTIDTIGNQKYILDESVLDDVSQTIHDWVELEESRRDFEIEYLKYSRIIVHMKHLKK